MSRPPATPRRAFALAVILATTGLLALAPAPARAADGLVIDTPPRSANGLATPCVLLDQAAAQQLDAFDGAASDNFGNDVAVEGDIAVVGAWLDDDFGPSSGSIYVYRHDGTQWTFETKLTPGDALPGDLFGWSVDVSGDRIAVGSYLHGPPEVESRGAVYIYRYMPGPGTWMEEAKLIGANEGDWFGWDVDIDGTNLLVGAPRVDTACPTDLNCDSGAAYLYTFNGTDWQLVDTPTQGQNANDLNGFAVALQSPWFAVGEPGFDGAASNGGRALLGGPASMELIGGGTGMQLGSAMAMHQDVLVIGSPGAEQVSVHNVENGTWEFEQILNASDQTPGDRFGGAVAIRGGQILVGARTRDAAGPIDAGAAYLFTESGQPKQWNEAGLLAISTPAAFDLLGQSVALGDGVAFVGASTRDVNVLNDGAAYAFNVADCNLNGQPDLCDIELGVSDDRNLNEIPDECEQIQPNTIVVDPNSPNPTSNGFTWTTAVHELRDALALAADPANEIFEIWVAAGTYTPTGDGDRTLSFSPTSNVAIYGGFLGNLHPSGGETMRDERDPLLNETILSGDLLGDDPPGPGLADNSYHVVFIDSVTDVLIDGFTIEAGHADGPSIDGHDIGGGLYIANVDDTVVVNNCRINDNHASNDGGGAYVFSATPDLIGCRFDDNDADDDAGALYLDASNVELINCDFTNNTAGDDGGALVCDASSPTLDDCIFTANAAFDDGGAMRTSGGSAPTLTGCTFDGNQATDDVTNDGDGGAVANAGSSPTFTNCTFSNNSATDDGGAMRNSGGSNPTIQMCAFNDNSAVGGGGAIANGGSSPVVTDTTFTGNTADDGAAILNGNSSPSFTDCTFIGNDAADEGGVMRSANSGSNPTLTNCMLMSNSADDLGGALFFINANGTITGTTITLNDAADGGGLYFSNSAVTMTGGSISDNLATGTGGGVCATTSGQVVLDQVSLSGNSAGTNGGAIYADSSTGLTVNGGSISTNNATGDGGGVYVAGGLTVALNGTSISSNNASNGGGLEVANGTVTVTDSAITGNLATFDGGGVHVSGGTTSVLRGSISGNVAFAAGGGGAGTGGFLNLDRTLVQANTAVRGGGFSASNLAHLNLVNVLILDNIASGTTAGDAGGGIHVATNPFAQTGDQGVRAANCTIHNNQIPAAAGNGAAVNAVNGFTILTNNIIWANLAPGGTAGSEQVNEGGGSVLADYNCIENFIPDVGDDGNITDDPMFVDALDLDGLDDTLGTTDDGLSIRPGSPCIDAADSTVADLVGVADDFAGDPRFLDDPQTADTGLPLVDPPVVVDMGAYEYQGVVSGCEGDVNGDNTVDIQDILQLLGAWGACEIAVICDEDINGDGLVDILDLLALLAGWGDCPVCGSPISGNCFVPNGTPGCNDEACCQAICAADPFCCDIEWDQICADAAIANCGG